MSSTIKAVAVNLNLGAQLYAAIIEAVQGAPPGQNLGLGSQVAHDYADGVEAWLRDHDVPYRKIEPDDPEDYTQFYFKFSKDDAGQIEPLPWN